MNKWKPALALVLVFVAGFALGVLATRVVVRRVVSQMLRDPQIAQQRLVGQVEARLINQLELAPVQQREVRRILRQAQEQIRGMRQSIQPRIAQISSNAAGQIMMVLTPDQQQRFERMRERNSLLMPGRANSPLP